MNRIRVASVISFGGLVFAAAGFILAIAFTTVAHTGWVMIGVGIFAAIAPLIRRFAAPSPRKRVEGSR